MLSYVFGACFPFLLGASSRMYAHGSEASIAMPRINQDDFALDSDFADAKSDISSSRGRGRSSRRRGFSEATRPNDYFKYLYQRLHGARGTYQYSVQTHIACAPEYLIMKELLEALSLCISANIL